MLIPVPSSRSALRKRGFHPAGELAAQLSRELHIPVQSGTLVCLVDHPPQKTLDLRERMALVRGRYGCLRSTHAQCVGLVDDVMTTGSTLRELSRLLVEHGAVSVIVLVAARTPMTSSDLAKSQHV